VIENTELFSLFWKNLEAHCFRWFALFCRGVSQKTIAKQQEQWASISLRSLR